jgi:phytoene/squalene synthetase
MTGHTQESTAALARSITWSGSKQTYYIGRLMVDRELVDDFYRAYAYFRWADDLVDVSSCSGDERISFIKRQRALIECLYSGKRPDDLVPEEEIVADLISHDRGENCGLQSFIRNMFAIIEFDAFRVGRRIAQDELTWYLSTLAKSVVDGLQYFIGNGHPYPTADDRYRAATAAHISHLLRDMIQDMADGYINISGEYLEAQEITPEDVSSPPFRAWVREQVAQARQCFCQGKRYLDGLDVLRCKIVGYWYCARFESVLDVIERDDYVLRAAYHERRKVSSWLRMAWLGVAVTVRHVVRRGIRVLFPDNHPMSSPNG